jgi:hypothetical protein
MTTSNWVTARLWSISHFESRSFWASILASTLLFSSQLALAQFMQQGPKLVGTDTGAVGRDAQGQSVALSGDGNTAIMGGFADNNGVGAAWVYTRSSDVWTQQGKLVGGGAVVNAAAQGSSVALSSDGNTAIPRTRRLRPSKFTEKLPPLPKSNMPSPVHVIQCLQHAAPEGFARGS